MYQIDPKKFPALNIDKVATTLAVIGVDELFPGIWQKRKSFEEEALDDLADSMDAAGINVVPVIVMPRNEGAGYWIIAGERRWRSAQRANQQVLKCEVGEFSYEQALFISTVENLQRQDLNPIEEAESYQALAAEFTALTHDDIARQIGKSRGHVSNYLRLLQLPMKVRDALIARKLTSSQARPLCTLADPSDQLRVADLAIKRQWSVKEIGNEVARVLASKAPSRPVEARLSDKDADLRVLERQISEITGVDCLVRRSERGNWQLAFIATHVDSFTGLLQKLGIEADIAQGTDPEQG